MASISDIREALLGRLYANWTATPVAWPNKAFTPPVNAAWIRPTFKPAETMLGEKGDSPVQSRQGFLFVDIFVPFGGGVAMAEGYANTLEELFRFVTVAGVECEDAYTEVIGKDDRQDLYHLQVVVRWHAWTD